MIELVVSSVPPVELKVTVDAIETPTLGPALELERSHVGLSLISMMQQLAGSSLLLFAVLCLNSAQRSLLFLQLIMSCRYSQLASLYFKQTSVSHQ